MKYLKSIFVFFVCMLLAISGLTAPQTPINNGVLQSPLNASGNQIAGGMYYGGLVGSIQIDFYGDSITCATGSGGTPPTGTNVWANYLQTNISFIHNTYSNYAYAGALMSDESGNYSSTGPHLDKNQPSVLCQFGGVNDIQGGASSNAAFFSLSNIWYQARADGKLVIASTIYPNFSWGGNTVSNINLINMNAIIRANPQLYDALCEGTNIVDADTVDHLHPSPSGAVKLMNDFILAFQKLPLPANHATIAAKQAYINNLNVSNQVLVTSSGGTVGSGGTVSIGQQVNGTFSIYPYNNSVLGLTTTGTSWPIQFNVGSFTANLVLNTDGSAKFGGSVMATNYTAVGSGGPVVIGNNPANALGIYVFNNSVVGFSTLWAGGWPMQFDVGSHSQQLKLNTDGTSTFGGNVTAPQFNGNLNGNSTNGLLLAGVNGGFAVYNNASTYPLQMATCSYGNDVPFLWFSTQTGSATNTWGTDIVIPGNIGAIGDIKQSPWVNHPASINWYMNGSPRMASKTNVIGSGGQVGDQIWYFQGVSPFSDASIAIPAFSTNNARFGDANIIMTNSDGTLTVSQDGFGLQLVVTPDGDPTGENNLTGCDGIIAINSMPFILSVNATVGGIHGQYPLMFASTSSGYYPYTGDWRCSFPLVQAGPNGPVSITNAIYKSALDIDETLGQVAVSNGVFIFTNMLMVRGGNMTLGDSQIYTTLAGFNLVTNASFMHDNSAWTFDDASGNHRLGFVKKGGAGPELAYSTTTTFNIVQSSSSDLLTTAMTSQTLTTEFSIDNSGNTSIPNGSLTIHGIKISSGTGSPNGVVTGSVGDEFHRTDGGSGTTLYIKESGTATTSGWVGK